MKIKQHLERMKNKLIKLDALKQFFTLYVATAIHLFKWANTSLIIDVFRFSTTFFLQQLTKILKSLRTAFSDKIYLCVNEMVPLPSHDTSATN